jgi:hypothetical protein
MKMIIQSLISRRPKTVPYYSQLKKSINCKKHIGCRM